MLNNLADLEERSSNGGDVEQNADGPQPRLSSIFQLHVIHSVNGEWTAYQFQEDYSVQVILKMSGNRSIYRVRVAN